MRTEQQILVVEAEDNYRTYSHQCIIIADPKACSYIWRWVAVQTSEVDCMTPGIEHSSERCPHSIEAALLYVLYTSKAFASSNVFVRTGRAF